MQAPSAPIDIKIEMGNPNHPSSQNILSLSLSLTQSQQKINSHISDNSLPLQSLSSMLLLHFDFYTQPNLQDEAYKYLTILQNSPLQILLKNKPDDNDDTIKCEVSKHAGFARVMYKIRAQEGNGLVDYMQEIFSSYKIYGVQLGIQVDWQLKGTLIHNNKNRTEVLIDYSKFQFISNVFSAQNFITCLQTFEEIQHNCQYYLNNPFLQLIKKSKVAKLNLKMIQFRKISKYYNKVTKELKEPKQKQQFHYLNKGIFRKTVNCGLLYRNKYLVDIQGTYESEDAFMRLIKVYSKFFEKLLEIKFYNDEQPSKQQQNAQMNKQQL